MLFECPACRPHHSNCHSNGPNREQSTNISWPIEKTLHMLHMLTGSYCVRCVGRKKRLPKHCRSMNQRTEIPPLLSARSCLLAGLTLHFGSLYNCSHQRRHYSLGLLCMLDTHDIPEIIFCRLRKDRTCWGSDGEVEHAAVPVAKSLADPLTDHQFEDAVQCLISSKLIKSESGALGKRKFTITPAVRDHVRGASRDQESLEWLCLVLICHAFPGRREEIR
jgi:hypothetical protein